MQHQQVINFPFFLLSMFTQSGRAVCLSSCYTINTTRTSKRSVTDNEGYGLGDKYEQQLISNIIIRLYKS